MTQTRRSRPPKAGPDDNTAASIAPEPDDEWQQRLQAALAQRQARRERQAATRAALAERREAGLRARHARKLSRTRGGGGRR